MSRKKLLFTDWRDFECGALAWRTEEGTRLGVGNPPGEPRPLHATTRGIPHGVRLEAQPARKLPVVSDWRGWGRIVYDEGCYYSWYFEINGHWKLGSGAAAHARPPESVVICRVESQDGIHWDEPQRCPVNVSGQSGFDGVTFFIDPVAPESERYKFVYCARFAAGMYEQEFGEYLALPAWHRDTRLTKEHSFGLFACASPDGLAWKPLPEPLMFHMSDTDTTVLWDDTLDRYVMYSRMYREARRWIGRAESEDFRHWTPVTPVVWPRLDDPPDYDFYLNGYTHYPDLPEYRLMFPMVWHRYTERSEIRLYSSADGVVWNQIPGGPVLTPGDPSEWDCEFLGCGKDLVPFGEDKVAIPYSGTCYPHKYPRWQPVWDAWQMAWATWPKDRICALKADHLGEFRTAPLTPAGRQLRLNCSTPLAGEVRVGLEGVEGRSADECDPVVGDHPSVAVSWKGNSDLGALAGKNVVLHFRLRMAKLFSIEWV